MNVCMQINLCVSFIIAQEAATIKLIEAGTNLDIQNKVCITVYPLSSSLWPYVLTTDACFALI